MPALDKAEAEALMSAYLDAELAPDEAARLEQYLEQSPEARAELAELRRVMELVGRMPTAVAPADLYDQVAKRIRRNKRTPVDSRLSAIVLPLQVISILVILAVAALNLMAELEQQPGGQLERDPSRTTPQQASPDRAPLHHDIGEAPRPVIP